MAIDHRIIQQIGVRDNAPILDRFNRALESQRNEPLRQQAIEQGRIRTDLLGAQATRESSGLNQALLDQGQIRQFDTGNAQSLKRFLDSGDTVGVNQELTRQRQVVAGLVQQGQLPESELAELDQALQIAQTPNGLQQLKTATDSFLTPISSQGKSLGQREFDANVAAVKADPNLETIDGQAASVALGLTAKASLTKEERIARDKELGNLVAEQKGREAGAAEGAKLEKQKKFKPQITKAVKLAEKKAAERGEVLTDLARMEASLPGVKEAVGQLIELSNVATSTLGGRAFDFLIKESGFGSTKGADARAKLVAIVDNQVLPLLKETFGAAFTVQEGENLKASLVDPDASPSQKKQQLEAFLAQKERNIRTKQTQLNLPSAGNADVPSSIDIGTASIEELIAERKRLGGQ